MSTELDALTALYGYARKGLQPRLTLTYENDPTNTIGAAVTALGNAEDQVKTLTAALAVYAAPTFWDELPPSKASNDKGDLARSTLQMIQGV
jgi:hypothetical protein